MEQKRIRVLNIEDEDVDHLALLRAVKEKELPYEIDRAANIAEGLKLIGEKEYDVALIDYRLPDGTGLEILGRLNETVGIILTGAGDEMVAVKAMKNGAYDYVMKDPVKGYFDLLPVVIHKALVMAEIKKEKKEEEMKLREKLDTEERFNKILLHRELRMKELRDENDLLEKAIKEMREEMKK